MWISCDEKLPRCQERVLLVFEKNNRTTRGENGRFIIEGFLKKRKSYYHEKEDKKNDKEKKGRTESFEEYVNKTE